MRRVIFFIVVIFGMILGTAGFSLAPKDAAVQTGMASFLPQPGELKGWEPVGTPQHMIGEDLFLLINGGAEIYYEYGFKQVIAQGFKNKNGKSFNLEIYEMQTPAAAYGIYTFKTGDEGIPLDVGNEGLLEDYYLNFWKGNVCVTVIGFDSEKETIEGIIEAAKVVGTKINTMGQKPALIHMLPENYKSRLKPNGVTYLKGNLALFNQYEFDTKNIFGLKQGVIGDYGDFKLFVFQYSDTIECIKWLKNAAKLLQKNPRFKNVTTQDSGFTMIDEKGICFYIENYKRYIFIFQGKKKEEAKVIINEIRGKEVEG
jgi:hypothetical protein